MKPTKLTNFSYTFYGPMTRQLSELGNIVPRSSGAGYFGVGRGHSRYLAIISAVVGFRGTPVESIVSQITERVQASLQPHWQQVEGSDEDGTEMFCVIEVEAE